MVMTYESTPYQAMTNDPKTVWTLTKDEHSLQIYLGGELLLHFVFGDSYMGPVCLDRWAQHPRKLELRMNIAEYRQVITGRQNIIRYSILISH